MDQAELNYKFVEACKSGDLELVKKYHKMIANVYVDVDIDWVLMSAADNGHLHVVKYLVDSGANIYRDDNWALCLATMNGHLNVINYLRSIDNGQKWKCSECIVRTTCTELCENYLKLNQDQLNAKFISACESGDLELAIKFHRMGANIYAYNNYALHQSARKGQLHIVKYLVENGGDIHACNDLTLYWTAHNGHLNVVNYLRTIDNGQKWRCSECIVRTTCCELCEDYLK